MGKGLFASLVTLVCLGVVMVSCNGDIDEDIDEGMVLAVNGQEPVFTYKDFDAIPQDYEEITNGTWKIKKVNGLVRQVSFCTDGVDAAPSPAPPMTEEEFFKEFMPVTADNQMVFYDRDYRDDPHYLQYYKGVPVEQGFWHFYFHEDGTMHGGDGRFIPIGQLDVNPSVNMATARKIVENFIDGSVEGEGKRIYLSIMSFPENGELKPRLVYVYKRQVWEEGEFIYVDAQTGRVLYKLGYMGGAPY